MKTRTLSLSAALLLLAGGAVAQEPDAGPPPDAWSGDAELAQPEQGEAIRAMERAVGALREALPSEFTGDLAADFALRAHALQQASDSLAAAFLEHIADEADPALREEAEAIAARAEEAVAALEAWLAANPPPESAAGPTGGAEDAAAGEDPAD